MQRCDWPWLGWCYLHQRLHVVGAFKELVLQSMQQFAIWCLLGRDGSCAGRGK